MLGMRGVRKEYDQKLADWASRAEREYVRRFLIGNGYKYTVYPDGQKGIDGEAENDCERFRVEVERSEFRRWAGNSFRYPTVHILERRVKYGQRDWLHFTVREDGAFAVVTFPQSIREERIKSNPNRFVRHGECAIDVPIRETLLVDLHDFSGRSIAFRNAERIRSGVRSLHGKAAMEFLGDDPPYGLSEDEWRDMRDEAEKPIKAAAYCNCKDAAKESSPDICRRPGWRTETCSQCGKFWGCKQDG